MPGRAAARKSPNIQFGMIQIALARVESYQVAITDRKSAGFDAWGD
jgi:hypothetical protein